MSARNRHEGRSLCEKKTHTVLHEPFGAVAGLTYVCVAPTRSEAGPGCLDRVVAAARSPGMAQSCSDFLTSPGAARRQGLIE